MEDVNIWFCIENISLGDEFIKNKENIFSGMHKN